MASSLPLIPLALGGLVLFDSAFVMSLEDLFGVTAELTGLASDNFRLASSSWSSFLLSVWSAWSSGDLGAEERGSAREQV